MNVTHVMSCLSRIIDPNAGSLFSDEAGEEDVESGTIYVLRSNSDDPYIKENRDVIHKIGVTGGDVFIVRPLIAEPSSCQTAGTISAACVVSQGYDRDCHGHAFGRYAHHAEVRA